MRARVRCRETWNDGVAEDDCAVARSQITTIQSLAEQQRIGVREIVVRRVHLVEVPVIASERERLTANANVTTASGDPERRIGSRDEKLGRRWSGARAARA